MYRSLLAAIFVLSLVLLYGCAGGMSKPISWQDESVDMVWPEPPEQPRIRYLRSLTGAEDFKEETRVSVTMKWLLGEQQESLSLLTPYAIAASRSGTVWVADNSAHMLFRLDLERRKAYGFQEFAGLQLVSPNGVAVDDVRQKVFLADATHGRVFVLDFAGNYLDSWGPEGGFDRPAGMAVDADGRLLVADAGAGVVQIFNVDGSLAKTVQSRISPDGRFNRPLCVATGPNGEILVLDAFAFRVEVQDAQGELIGTIGQLGDAAGYLARPRGLAVDKEGHVFVADAAFDNVQVFDMAGNLLMFLGGPGRGAGQFNLPAGLFVDSKGRFFVADAYNRRVQAFQLLH